MSNAIDYNNNVSPIRPHLEVVECRVADLDDGYTRLATMILEELAGADFTKRQFKVLLAVIRLTYGWNKPRDRIANSQISGIAKLPVKRVSETRVQLIKMNVLTAVGQMIGINKNVSEWALPQIEVKSLKIGDEKSLNLGDSNPSKQGDTIDIIPKTVKTTTQTHDVVLDEVEKSKKKTPRQAGTNPRAKKTNPRAKMPEFDRDRFKSTWNCKAESHGLPKILSITTTTENGLKRLWASHLKQCDETGRTPRDVDTLINGYIEFGYQPTEWAKGSNPTGKKYGIETALRQEKIDEILGRDD
ncbi:replication protein [Yersinia enterocolitica]|nr:replication protein [Yersinia enterocolitica]